MQYTFYALGIFVVVLIIYLVTRPRIPNILDHWNTYFTDRQFSAIEFYDSIEAILNERKAPETEYYRIDFQEKGFFSHYREYCRIRFGQYTFDICAAPYGTGYFISWWFGEDIKLVLRIIFMIPIIGWILRYSYFKKTYHVLDTESMFQAAVHQAVLDTIERLTTDKGLRVLSELERQPKGYRKRP